MKAINAWEIRKEKGKSLIELMGDNKKAFVNRKRDKERK